MANRLQIGAGVSMAVGLACITISALLAPQLNAAKPRSTSLPPRPLESAKAPAPAPGGTPESSAPDASINASRSSPPGSVDPARPVPVPEVVGSPSDPPLELPTILFDTNSFELRPKYRAMLRPVAEMMSTHSSQTLLLRGHPDPTGTARRKAWLSKRRARSVKNALVRLGVKKSRIRLTPGTTGADQAPLPQSVELMWQ